MSRNFFNRAASDWDQRVKHDHRKIKETISSLPELDFECNQILDVGSGTGVLVPFLKGRYGCEAVITEFDYAREMIKRAEEKYKSYSNINFIVGDFYTYPLQEEYYSLVICYSVFPHFADKKQVLKNSYSCLKKAGLLVIFHSESREAINEMHHSKKCQLPEEAILPPADEVAGMARDMGFKVITEIDNSQKYLLVLQK